MVINTSKDSGQLALRFEPEQRLVFRVGDLNAALQKLFERQFRSIWVAGEISGCRAATSGHYYFALKEGQSQIKCALFKAWARVIRSKPQDGLAVIVRGSLEIYDARGEYQLIVEGIEPQGAGALQLAFEHLKQKLRAEGLFEQSRKRALPKVPRRIGLVTSPGGAVIRDMLQVFGRRFPGLHVRIFPAQVQGAGSTEQVCRGIEYFSRVEWADLVILARGGGSLEDLWTFKEEGVARAIVASRVPLISAVGHETDFTIADFVADLRAATPSAAAEMAICTRESLLEQIRSGQSRALQAMRYRLLRSHRDLHQRGTERASTLVHRAVGKSAQRLDELEHQLRLMPRRLFENKAKRLRELTRRLEATDLRLRFARDRQRHAGLRERLFAVTQERFWGVRKRLEMVEGSLGHLSPFTVLSRGYAIVEGKDRSVIRRASETSPRDQIRVRLGHGELDATVDRVRDGE